ncbi:Unknown protein [Striga hermonthica]|uniref:Uncharacterized protein n=1 Tax=Striga hermonthica TaxID=68872 RepID=A0A9N7RPL2_STRHE|nr:Unknown protein [Striga hermonthica]
MDAFPIDKILISGATLASLLHRSSSSAGDIHGYLFGHAAVTTSNPLSDHPTADSDAAAASLLTATVTSFLSLPSHLPLPSPAAAADSSPAPLIGSFSARRKTPLRPSMKDTAAAASLHGDPSLAHTPQNSTISLAPSLFLLITTPFQDQLIHTHEYRAFQYKGGTFEPKTLQIVNLGPSFRSQYDSFSPSAAYTGELEDLYDKMLAKIDGLSRLVEQTNAKVQEQENHNMKLRCRVAGLE